MKLAVYMNSLRIMHVLEEQGKFLEIVDLMTRLREQIGNSEKPRLTEMYHEFSHEDTFHDIIYVTSQKTDNFSAVKAD